MADLVVAQTKDSDAEIEIEPIPPPSEKDITEYTKALRKDGIDITSPEEALKSMLPMGQGVWIRVIPTIGRKQEILPLLLPSEDTFRAYDRIAKYIKDYTII